LVEVTDSQGQKKYQLIPLYFPAYFRSMSVRLYSFDGKAVVPKAGDCKVVTWTWQEIEGVRYKMVTKTQPFNTYEEALAFVARQSSGNYNIVSSDPLVSPVPLDELKDFVLRHDSEIMVTDTIPQIRIFEYVK
jgi:hypothetical protein